MGTSEKLNELKTRQNAIELDGLIRQKIKSLLDNNSFVEMGAFITHRSTDFNLSEVETPSDGVVTGYGTIDGRLVYVYGQNSSVLGGSIGEMGAKKIGKIYEQSLKMGAPIISILDSNGVRLQEGLDSLEGYGEIFKYQSMASGVIPQISLVLGNSLGINSIIPALSDFIFMEQNSKMFVNSPNTINGLEGKTTTFEQVGGSKTHSTKSGLAHFCYETYEECLNKIRELINFLPSNNLEDAPLYGLQDDLNRIDESLNDMINSDEIDIKAIILSLSDNKYFMEIKKDYSKNMIIGFSRFNGSTVGVVANQTSEGKLDTKALKKASEFINFCDSFNIPILTLTDTCGFKSSLDEELNGLSKSVAKFIYSFINATVPKINVIVNQAFGSSYLTMNSKHIGADIVYSWPNSQIAIMEAEAFVNVISDTESSEKDLKIQDYKANGPYTAAKRGYVDDIIEPAATRKYIIASLEMLQSKREGRPAKKHSSSL